MAQQYTTTGQQQQRSAQGTQQLQTGQASQTGGQLPQQYRQVLDTVSEAVQVCGWCADQCITSADPNMIECIRMCEDVVELGETLLALAPRSSRFTADVAQTFAQAAQACAQECGRHSASHCQECASALNRAAQSVQQLSSAGGASAQGVGTAPNQLSQ